MAGRMERVEVADPRGDGRALHAAWHPERRTLVISHWRDNVCVATTPLRADQLGPLAALLVRALAEEAARPAPAPPPSAPPRGRELLSALDRRWRRMLDRQPFWGRPAAGPASVDPTVDDAVDWPA